MRKTIRAVSALGAILLLALSARGFAQVPPTTVSDYANALGAQAALLDTQISDRQRRGEMAAAQRLVLIAAMVRRSGEEFRSAEQQKLTDDIATLPAPVPARIKAALEMATKAVELGADHPDFVDQALEVANALIAAVPVRIAHPVIYGLLSRDLAGADWTQAGDIVFYGYRLFDPVFKTVPLILYGRTELDPAAVIVKGDRIVATLPEEIRKAVKFAPDACDRRPSFTLRVRDTYAQPRGFWPLAWNFEVLTNTDLIVLQSPAIYAAKITVGAETNTRMQRTETFRQKSNYMFADCETTRSADAVFTPPQSAVDITCTAKWEDTSNETKTASRCEVKDGAVHATGELTAAAKSCSPDKLCTCSYPAHGWLVASGTYRLEGESSQMKVSTEPQPLSFPDGGVAERKLAVASGEKLRHVSLEISRRACAAVADAIDLTISQEPDAMAVGVSRTGAFRALFKEGSLRVGAADALADVGKTP